MNAKLKAVLLILGAMASVLIITQLTMGVMIVRGGGSFDLNKLVKAHQHSGYLTVAVVLAYIGLSLSAISSLPARSKV